MATPMVRVRMRRRVSDFVQVIDLEPGAVYELRPEAAEQFIANGMADPAEGAEAEVLETAPLRAGRRRG